MKTVIITLLSLLFFLTGSEAQTLDLKIMSFNMQQPYGTNWDGRKASAAQIINTYQGDIVGTQELVNYQRDYISANCSGYSLHGEGRDCGDNGEGSWIFYKTSKFTLDAANSGSFWFSDNPDVCAKGWDPNYSRICSYVHLTDKVSGKSFYVFNAHFPTPDQSTARTKSVQLLCARAAARKFPNDPVIFTGDFNSIESESQINYVKSGAANPSPMRDSYRDLYPTGSVTTGFGVKFDYIFIENKNNISALTSQVVTTPSASDHMPITATIRLNFGTVPVVSIAIPGKIEAESYSDMLGIQTESTTDAGGGFNAGWIDTGDWMEYNIDVAKSGTYDIAFRSASLSDGGSIRMEVDGIDATGVVALPVTGGWQTWESTVKSKVILSAGKHIVKFYVIAGGFNLNYTNVTESVAGGGPGFLHANGTSIMNNSGNFVIQAANIGNYMVQEGYMLNLGGGYQYVIKQKIADVVGQSNADKFYQDYYKNYLVKADVDSLAKWGFNSIRLPMHYNLFTPLGQPDVFLESGFVMVDSIISWCKANNIYVILDLHAAPGGQNSGDISDYISGQPSLWESVANRGQTVKLWKKFATRYANEQYVGGYDLINETNWTIPGNTLLMNLMQDITTAIRTVDNNHLLFIEGNSYANDYNGLTPKWDNNMAYSFHKYWNDVDDASLNFIFAIRDAQNVPVWLGEFGENSNHWITETVALMNKHNIGWAIWPFKKMGSVSGMVAFNEPNNWSALAAYINGGAKPSATVAQAIIDELAENVKLSNCKINHDYLFALFPAPNDATVPFALNIIPGKIDAVKYDKGKNGIAYSDMVYQTAQFGAGGGNYTAWNTGWYYRNDGVDIQYSNAENAAVVGWTETGEWMQYTADVVATGMYSVKIRAAGNGGKVSLSCDGNTIVNNATVPSTSGWDAWETIDLGMVNLIAGTHTIKVMVSAAGYNINYLEFEDALSTDVVDIKADSHAVYPNPFDNEITARINANGNFPLFVKVLDVRGVEVLNPSGNYTNQNFSFGSDLAAGVYFIQFIYQDNIQMTKVVKN